MIAKTANQLYRESGSTLSFKEWIQDLRERHLNADGSPYSIVVDKTLNDSVQSAINTGKSATGYKSGISGKTVLGIPQTAIFVVGGLVAIYAGYEIYKAVKKQKS